MKKIVALLLLLCLWMTLCSCGGDRAAILCVAEGAPAGQALAAQDRSLSCALAVSDLAALQQLDAGSCDFALVTAQGLSGAQTGAVQMEDVTLAAFCILSRDGGFSEWDVHTRVTVVGEQGGYGDALAQQALTCALHGAVRYMDGQDALRALRRGQTDVVMGLFAPQDERVAALLKAKKDVQLLSMPEGLLGVKLPDASMEAYALTVQGRTAQTYALCGALVRTADAGEKAAQRVLGAAKDAGLTND